MIDAKHAAGRASYIPVDVLVQLRRVRETGICRGK